MFETTTRSEVEHVKYMIANEDDNTKPTLRTAVFQLLWFYITHMKNCFFYIWVKYTFPPKPNLRQANIQHLKFTFVFQN